MSKEDQISTLIITCRVAQGNLTPRPSTDTDVSLSTHPAPHVRPDCGFCIALRFLPFLVDQ